MLFSSTMRPFTRIICAGMAAAVVVVSPLRAENIKNREILGARIGGLVGTSSLERAFGKGSEMELYFIEGLSSRLGVAISLSSHNFGYSKDRQKNLQFLTTFQEIELKIYSLSAGFTGLFNLSERLYLSAETGFGLYTINAVVPAGFYEGHITKNRFGLHAGLWVNYRLTRRGLSLNLGVKTHHVFSGTGRNNIIYFYTGQESIDFQQITVGVSIFTGG
ncbi:MAG: hypothetical protein JXB45_06215 [Candidatus Krumholzibacteriota bacterium]|nr:hypothetical protein [Candidatus Krumholzibacteriota bacterium]